MGTWAMFPDPKEQEQIKTAELMMLAHNLFESSKNSQLAIAAVYDLLYAAEDREKAKKLFEVTAKCHPLSEVLQTIALLIKFRVLVDHQKIEDQVDFLKLCSEVLDVEMPLLGLSLSSASAAAFAKIAQDMGFKVVIMG